ncbi:piggyBac transposable element-derived protein 4 [Trichonephila clavipes]|nr:piggyBac transposable element-derived protein 4 [Trichonephila clavipes]
MTSVNRTKKDGTKEEAPCPKAAVVYNDVMGGADRFDQRKERYLIRRSIKWGHRIFYFLIDLVIINIFIQLQVREIKRSLNQANIPYSISSSVNRGIFLKKGGPACFQAKQCVVLDDVCLASVENHMTNWNDVGNVIERDKKRGPVKKQVCRM